MNELIVVRHGESEHHVNGYTGGWTDLPLTARGREQAQRTAAYLRDQIDARPARLVSSDLARARATAEILAPSLGLQLTCSGALRELNNGVARGLRQDEAARLKRPRTEPALDWVPYPEAESWRMMYQRIAGYMDQLEADEPGCTLLVSHANAMICIVNWWLRLDDERCLTDLMYELDPCSVTWLRVDRNGCRCIVRLNDTGHLLDWRPPGSAS